ncbi:MAG: glycosyltransferase [Pseudomonadota bacterium]
MSKSAENSTAFEGNRRLRVIHCVRSPVGGIFRHIQDVIRYQNTAGIDVGLICDSLTGDTFEEEQLAELAPHMALGVARLPMARHLSFSDIKATRLIYKLLKQTDVDVIHAHGAKGGAYGRLVGHVLGAKRRKVGKPGVVAVYSPHGGSLHFDKTSIAGRLYFALERIMEAYTDEFVFVSRYEVDAFTSKVGQLRKPYTIAYNGLQPEELEPVAPSEDAADFLYAGHMRDLKGTDLFIDAIDKVNAQASRSVSAVMVGYGDDRPRYEADVRKRKLDHLIRFQDPAPIREVFPLGRTLVVPSRAESMPYIVIEALGARMPVIATSVGGIPEIFADHATDLVPPGDSNLIAKAMLRHLENPDAVYRRTDSLHNRIASVFSIERMCHLIDEVYARHLPQARRGNGTRSAEAVTDTNVYGKDTFAKGVQ